MERVSAQPFSDPSRDVQLGPSLDSVRDTQEYSQKVVAVIDASTRFWAKAVNTL